MRKIFIHGFGENKSIFDKIAPSIGGEQLFINLWDEVGYSPRLSLNVVEFASDLVAKFQILPSDIIIGHSLGGWVGIHIKQQCDCKCIQIGSWTIPDRVISPIKNKETIYWLSKHGVYLNRFTKWYAVRKGFKNKPSRQVFEQTLSALMKGNRHSVVNQLRLIFEPVPILFAEPELRIHAVPDNIIRKPKTQFYEVPGDHFSLVTYPLEVLIAIKGVIS